MEIDESKSVIADGYILSEKDKSLTATIASNFKQPQPQFGIEGMAWKGGDAIREMYAEGVEILGETYDVVLIARLRRPAD
jgi:glycerol kinase